jgi:hypothetical protein
VKKGDRKLMCVSIVVHISQGIPKPNPMTVFGDEVFALTEDLGDGRVRGEATVKVTRAIA